MKKLLREILTLLWKFLRQYAWLYLWKWLRPRLGRLATLFLVFVAVLGVLVMFLAQKC